MKKDVDKFWQWVNRRIDELGLNSFRELERRSGFAPGAIGKRKNAHKFPTVEMAEGLCRALQVSWAQLWEQAGFISGSSEGFETFEALWDVTPNWKKKDVITQLRATIEEKQKREPVEPDYPPSEHLPEEAFEPWVARLSRIWDATPDAAKPLLALAVRQLVRELGDQPEGEEIKNPHKHEGA